MSGVAAVLPDGYGWPLAFVLLLLVLWLYWRRLRDRERVQQRVAASEARLKLSLWASGDELWSADIASGALQRENRIPGLEMTPDGQGETLAAFARCVHPDDLDNFSRELDAHLRGATEQFEAVYRARDGQGLWRWLQSRGRVVERAPDGRPRRIGGITSDVSLIKQGEEVEVRLNAELTRRIAELEAAQAAVRAGDEKLMLALWGSDSEYWESDLVERRLQRFAPLQHLMRAVDDQAVAIAEFHRFVHPDDLDALVANSIAHAKGEIESFDVIYRARRRDGRWAWLRSRGRATQRDGSGRALRMVGITFDVSRLKRTEEELLKLNEQLEQRVASRTAELSRSNETLSGTLEELRRTQAQLVEREKLAALGGLVAGIAHEINTPLGIGVTAASHLREQALKVQRSLDAGQLGRSELAGFIGTAAQSSELLLVNLQRAGALVRSFKQVAVDQASEARRVIDLRAYLEEILLSLKPTLKKASHEVRVDCPEHLSWDTFPGALYQIVVNLLMNALHHAFDQVERGRVEISASRVGDELLLCFADNGCGMAEEVRRRIFEPFYTTRRGQGGSGLGLHIVFNLVTQVLDGSIECRSAPGAGTRFELRLPLQRPPA